MKKDEKVVPIHACAFFSVSRDAEFHQLLQYDYEDPERYYLELQQNEEELSAELEKLWTNMQGYLEEEVNKINGTIVYPQVKFCDIQHRGKNPSITWIITFKGEFQQGINVYETKTDEEELEYDCYALWQFPEETKIKRVETKLYYDIFGSRVVLWAEQGMKIGGFERIRFEFI